MVAAVASLAAFFQVLGRACTRASNSLVTARGGVGILLFPESTDKADTDREGFPELSLFLFWIPLSRPRCSALLRCAAEPGPSRPRELSCTHPRELHLCTCTGRAERPISRLILHRA